MNFKKYQASLNLYNAAETSWTSGVKDDNGNVTGSTTSHFTSNYTAVESGTKYSITGIYASGSSTAARIYYYDSSKAWISRTAALRDNPLVFETPVNCAYIQVQCANGADGTNFMLVKGEYTSETMPSFEPYGGVWNSIPYYIYGTETDAFTSYPVQLYTDGQPVTSWSMKGNTQTSGTPSPSNPVTVDGVGEETANLFNIDDVTLMQISDSPRYAVAYTEAGTYSATAYGESGGYCYMRIKHSDNTWEDSQSIVVGSSINIRTMTIIEGETLYIYCASNVSESTALARFESWQLMVNKGETVLPFEPNGKYKISILKDLQALTPIYLSQPLRKSLDGTAFDTLDSTGLVTYNVDEYGQPQTATTETVTVPTITTTGGTVTLDVDTTIKPSEIDLTYHGWHEHEPLKRENGAWT